VIGRIGNYSDRPLSCADFGPPAEDIALAGQFAWGWVYSESSETDAFDVLWEWLGIFRTYPLSMDAAILEPR
jgi:hypothetical protein